MIVNCPEKILYFVTAAAFVGSCPRSFAILRCVECGGNGPGDKPCNSTSEPNSVACNPGADCVTIVRYNPYTLGDDKPELMWHLKTCKNRDDKCEDRARQKGMDVEGLDRISCLLHCAGPDLCNAEHDPRDGMVLLPEQIGIVTRANMDIMSDPYTPWCAQCDRNSTDVKCSSLATNKPWMTEKYKYVCELNDKCAAVYRWNEAHRILWQYRACWKPYDDCSTNVRRHGKDLLSEPGESVCLICDHSICNQYVYIPEELATFTHHTRYDTPRAVLPFTNSLPTPGSGETYLTSERPNWIPTQYTPVHEGGQRANAANKLKQGFVAGAVGLTGLLAYLVFLP